MSIQEARRAAMIKAYEHYFGLPWGESGWEQAHWEASWNAALDSVEAMPGAEVWQFTAEGTKRFKDVTIRVEVKS